jgi:dTDP-4-amino-4,6-dideoxygalactose transaminase
MKNKIIKFFDYEAIYKMHQKELIDIIDDVGNRGAYIMQDDLKTFENKIADYTGCKYAVGVANATDAMQLMFKAGNLDYNDEVIFCSHTMIATASAINFSGAKPIPVEAGNDHLIDCASIENSINKNTKAIVVTQLNGRIANMNNIQNIADKYNLDIYEDSAQALGAKYNGIFAGNFGKAGCISFYPAKIIGCLGDGGMVLSNDKEIYEKIILMRDHGRDEHGNIKLWGYNSRLDNLQAAILNYFFKFHEENIERRRQIARIYHEKLINVDQLSLPPHPDEDADRRDIYQNFEIEAERRDELRAFLSKNNIGTILQWGGKAVHQFKSLNMNFSLKFTEKMMARSLLLPLNTYLTDDDIEQVCKKIIEFY